jgi:hypothetical protein
MPFKRCTCCVGVWETRVEFLTDPAIRVGGYQASFVAWDAGLFLFHHATCQTTLALGVPAFADLLPAPVFPDFLTGTAECGGYCLDLWDLRPCSARCRGAALRDLLQRLMAWPKVDGRLASVQ